LKERIVFITHAKALGFLVNTLPVLIIAQMFATCQAIPFCFWRTHYDNKTKKFFGQFEEEKNCRKETNNPER